MNRSVFYGRKDPLNENGPRATGRRPLFETQNDQRANGPLVEERSVREANLFI
jgi:hypothetical protein